MFTLLHQLIPPYSIDLDLSNDANFQNNFAKHIASRLEMAFNIEFSENIEDYHLNISWTDDSIKLIARAPKHLFFQRTLGVLELIWPLFLEQFQGALSIWIGDYSPTDFVGLSFASENPRAVLIPDTYFMITRGYSENLKSIDVYLENETNNPPIISKAFWRGTLTGDLHFNQESGEVTNQRIALCRASLTNKIIDAKLTSSGGIDHSVYDSLAREGLTYPQYVPFWECLRYHIQIDVDGYGPAWSGLFNKLYTGRPVLKIKSAKNLRQWYYFDLVDDYNIIFVEKDLSNLAHKIDCLLKQEPAKLVEIGNNGRDVIKPLSYKKVVRQTHQRLLAQYRA
jgi:hypothetical protein